MTKKGTRYALTINKPSKLVNFFYSHNDTDATVDVAKYVKMQEVYVEFYYANTAIIKENNANNSAVRNEFLRMMKENDLGIDLFEVNATFDDFEYLELDANNNIIPNNNCN